MQFANAFFSRIKKYNAALLDKEAANPERQRGIWSFLTWSFFLANFLAATEIIGGSAHAATVDSDHGGASHSDGGNSYSGGAQPEMQHLTLESLSADHEGHAASAKVAVNPAADASNAGPDVAPVHNVPVAQAHLDATGDYGGGPPAAYNAVDGSSSSVPQDVTSNVTNVINTIEHPVVDVVEHLTAIVTPIVNSIDSTLQGATTAVTQVVDTIGDFVGGAEHFAQDLTGTLATTLNTTFGADVFGDGLTPAMSTLNDVGVTATHAIGASLGDGVAVVSDWTSPVAALLDHDGPAGSTITSAADSPSGLHDFLGGTLHSLGVSSSGSLSFAAEAPNTIASGDGVSNTSGYSQFNLAMSDAGHDAGVSLPTPADTGGITTIVASAIGIGPHATNITPDSAGHGSDQPPVHLPVLDDLHSHLHLGVLG
jgi:hypothetical protein